MVLGTLAENADASKKETKRCYCSICGLEIAEEEHEDFDGMCCECWDDQLTE
jgi:hypothetical protein